jgi:hypothetical protein
MLSDRSSSREGIRSRAIVTSGARLAAVAIRIALHSHPACRRTLPL